jgi:hypothetical protein
VTFYLVSNSNEITIGASHLNLSTFIFPVSLEIYKSHARSEALFKRAGEGQANAIPLMVLEIRVLESLRAVFAIKLHLF